MEYLETVNYFIDKELGKDNQIGREDFEEVFPNLDRNMPIDKVRVKLSEIVAHYTEIMNSSKTLLYYLCFDNAIGFAPRKKGYALDPYWAQGVYRAAKVDYRVYERLVKVVGENVLCSRYLPRQLVFFSGEVHSGSFPVPKKNGPAITRDQLRNLCITECMMLLNDELRMQINSDSKIPALAANDLIDEAFSHVEFTVSGVAKPTASTAARIWNNQRDKARYEVKTVRWLENKEKSNRWYNRVPFMYWISRIHFKTKNVLLRSSSST